MRYQSLSFLTPRQDYINEISSTACRALVRKYKELASEDIRFDVTLAEACFEDRQRLCANVPPVSATLMEVVYLPNLLQSSLHWCFGRMQLLRLVRCTACYRTRPCSANGFGEPSFSLPGCTFRALRA